jgi:hypothetical protein
MTNSIDLFRETPGPSREPHRLYRHHHRHIAVTVTVWPRHIAVTVTLLAESVTVPF